MCVYIIEKEWCLGLGFGDMRKYSCSVMKKDGVKCLYLRRK